MGRAYVIDSLSRHFLPVYRNSQLICEGFPSRTQYIKGQPRDERPEYPYGPSDEEDWCETSGYVRSRYRKPHQQKPKEVLTK